MARRTELQSKCYMPHYILVASITNLPSAFFNSRVTLNLIYLIKNCQCFLSFISICMLSVAGWITVRTLNSHVSLLRLTEVDFVQLSATVDHNWLGESRFSWATRLFSGDTINISWYEVDCC